MTSSSFAINFFFTMARSGLIMDAAAMEADMADLGGGIPPESESSMIYEVWYDLAARPYPCLEVAVA
jgi:hypothetical protein